MYIIIIRISIIYIVIIVIIRIIIVSDIKYLIVEKNQGFFSINQFAEKYIINRFFPDSETYSELSNKIDNSIKKIKRELKDLEEHIANDDRLKRIIQDWQILTEGDKIAAAKAFKLYDQVKNECHKSSKFFIQTALYESLSELKRIEISTMHPYIKYQKARIIITVGCGKQLYIIYGWHQRQYFCYGQIG